MSAVRRTIPAVFLDRAAQHPDRLALIEDIAGDNRSTRRMTWREWRDASMRFAAALSTSQAKDCKTVAILAGNSTIWPIADLGTLLAGRTSVGIYPTSAPVQIERMLLDCAAGLVVTDDPAQLQVILEMRDRLPALRVVVAACTADVTGDVQSWSSWLDEGEIALRSDLKLGASIEAVARSVKRDDPAIIIYTSGSTGEPKGAVLSHGCIDASAHSIAEVLELRETDTMVSFLPYSHAAERIFGLYTRILCGIEVALVNDPTRLSEVARSYKPTVFGGLPRYYEKLYEETQLTDHSALELLGGRVRRATSGGATLPVAVAEGLQKTGITVLGAYGLTEHLCCTFNPPDDVTFDTAGRPMPGTELRIADDGEILVRRSELTFSGYLNLPDATRAAFTDDGEWLRTGDLGSLDNEGRLRVTGRKKELLALSNGKMVAPLPIEAQLAAHPLIAHAVLHAEGRKFVSALIALRPESVQTWAREAGITCAYEELVSHPLITAEIQNAVNAVNATLSRAESIRRFLVIGHELSVAARELTPTHKVRRKAVIEKYSAQLDALYS